VARRPLELRGGGIALLDEPLALEVRGAAPDERLGWRARIRDDDGRVWRAEAEDPAALLHAWAPAKAGTGAVAALLSLRPVELEVRVETPDGRTAARTLTRQLAADGVKLRRWRDGLAATLHLPRSAAGAPEAAAGAAAPAPTAPVLFDATDGAEEAALAAPLLASRGVVVLVVGPPPRGTSAEDALASARERLAAVPAVTGDPVLVDAVLPPGVPAREPAAHAAAAWDALLERLGASPRVRD
jgi:hypothetical protein